MQFFVDGREPQHRALPFMVGKMDLPDQRHHSASPLAD